MAHKSINCVLWKFAVSFGFISVINISYGLALNCDHDINHINGENEGNRIKSSNSNYYMADTIRKCISMEALFVKVSTALSIRHLDR